MKHVAIGIVVAVLTIVVSIFVLSESDTDYENDAKLDKSTSIGQIFQGEVYDFLPIDFVCRDFSASSSNQESRYGCVLFASITNTSIFEQQLVLDGDYALSVNEERFESSDELSRQYVPNNGLSEEIGVGGTASGGIFFDVPRGVEIEELEIFEGVDNQPIVVNL